MTDHEAFGKLSQELVSQIPQKGRSHSSEHHKVKLRNSGLSDLPSGSVLDVTAIDPARLSFGDVVCWLHKKEATVGRFLHSEGEYLVLSLGNQRHKLLSSHLLGRVVRAAAQGRDFDPNQQNPITRVINRFTLYGARFAKTVTRLAAV